MRLLVDLERLLVYIFAMYKRAITLFLLLLTASVATASPLIIYHAFDETLGELTEKVAEIRRYGFDAIQVSPLQQSRNFGNWHDKYRPLSYSIGNSIGSEGDLKKLTAKAHENGLRVIVDVVLNHLAAHYFDGKVVLKADWERSFSDSWLHAAYRKDLNEFYAKRLYGDSVAAPRDSFLPWSEAGWIGGALPQLNSDLPEVRALHLGFLRKLAEMGVDGFRFDAVEQMSFAAIRYYLDSLALEGFDLWSYSEILHDHKWGELMSMTDYRLLGALIKEFSYHGSLANLRQPPSIRPDSITFARNHDTWAAEQTKGFRGVNLTFADEKDTLLASLFVLGRHDGIPLVLNQDLVFLQIKNGVAFRQEMNRRKAPMETIGPSETLCEKCSSQTVMLMDRGGEGFLFLNKGGSPIEVSALSISGYPKIDGRYEEQGGPRILVAKGGRLTCKNSDSIEIPARTGVYFVKTSGN